MKPHWPWTATRSTRRTRENELGPIVFGKSAAVCAGTTLMGRGPSIEGRKNAADAQKAKVFTKLIREITVAARAGGADPTGNPRLRLAIDRALATNMTKE